jgi:hypothetical protein
LLRTLPFTQIKHQQLIQVEEPSTTLVFVEAPTKTSLFFNNSALPAILDILPASAGFGSGGACQFQFPPLVLHDLSANECTSGYGAIIAYEQFTCPNASVSFKMALNNTALFGGAITFLQSWSNDSLAAIFQAASEANEFTLENTARYGPNSASTPIAFAISDSTPRAVWPGQSFPIQISLIDLYSVDVFSPAYWLYLNRSGLTAALINNQADLISQDPDSYYFSLSDLRFVLSPNSSVSRPFVLLDGPNPQLPATILPPLSIPFLITACPPGYTLIELTQQAVSCISCPESTFNFDGMTCRPCPLSAGSEAGEMNLPCLV